LADQTNLAPITMGAPGARRLALPMAAGLAAVAAAFALPTPLAQAMAVSAGVALLGVALMLALRDLLAGMALRRRLAILRRIVECDAHAALAAGGDGTVLYQNPVAIDRFGDCRKMSLNRALGSYFAAPTAALLRLQGRAGAQGRAHEVVELRRGQMRISAQHVGPALFLWRFEMLSSARAASPGPDLRGLAQVTVSPQGAIIGQNDAMRGLIGRRALSVDDLCLEGALHPGEIHSLRGPEEPIRALVLEPELHDDRHVYILIPEADLPPREAAQDIDALPVPVIELSGTGVLHRANAQARSLLGVGSVRGQPLERLVEGLGRPLDSWLRDAVHSPRGTRTEVVRVANSGSERFLQITLGLCERDGRRGFMAVLQDATELKTLEAQFVQSQKMQAIGQLAGGVAHDFNNLLTAISGHCDLLLLRHDQGDPDYPDLEQINQNANRAASLVSQLLAFSRKQTLRPELVDLRDTLSDLSHLLNRLVGEKVRLELRHDPNQRHVRADRRQLEQVIMNLVVNARDAMPEGGRILIETREEHLDAVLHRDRAEVPAGDYVVITVSDEGAGIPPDRIGKIFEPFYTTKRQGEGTGLGLSTVYGIVKQSGGFVFADSDPGKGTIFTLYLRSHGRAPAVAPPPPRPQPEAPAQHSEGVILLVEDEAPVRAFAARALRLRGLTVLEADCAEAALDLLKGLDTPVDVFVTDVIMPGRDGPSWVQEALETRPNTKVVFMSGYAEESFAEAQAAIPNSVFLPKPFSLSQLTGIVQEQLA
jgi:two-component system cell cycle sensor histidine kinase/response regulator CckA